jgi:predicted secreted Zn-dependent protease
MPSWPDAGSASDADQSTWNRFLAALAAHEQGHVDLINQHFSSIETRLVGLSPDEAKRLWAEMLSALQDASDSYDGDTDHGRKQGTVIDIGPATPNGPT